MNAILKTQINTDSYITRSQCDVMLMELFSNNNQISGKLAANWNSLSISLRYSTELHPFLKDLKTYL